MECSYLLSIISIHINKVSKLFQCNLNTIPYFIPIRREKEGLLHRFEIDEKTKHLKRPKADPNKIIKSFSRPAAGQIMTDPSLLRPGPVLLSTIKYLFTKYCCSSY